ncbi:MAG: PepSY domain-containing protein [Terrimicrobiaceae bacterium]
MNPAIRKFHRVVSPWLVLPLVLTLATGVTYRIGRAWFGMPKETGAKILSVHTGEWLGTAGSSAYVLLVGGGLLALVLTGTFLLIKSRAKAGARFAHRILAAILLLPLAASAITGIAFKIGEEWFHLPDKTLDLFMTIHEGAWLGQTLKPFYVLVVGLGLLVLAATGVRLTGLFARKPSH